jgi:hypothetical protein
MREPTAAQATLAAVNFGREDNIAIHILRQLEV